MYEYERSIQAIKEYNKIPSSREWNKIAKEHDFLSTLTLIALSNEKNFLNLCKKVRKKI